MSTLLVQLRNLSIRSRNKMLIEGVDVDVRPKRVTALCGPSGSGKSLTARAMMGVLDVYPGLTSGSLIYPPIDNSKDWFEGIVGSGFVGQQTLLKQTKHLRGKYFTYSPQSASSALNPGRTIGQQLKMAIERREVPPSSYEEEIKRILSEVGLSPKVSMAIPAQLSGGMCQRAALAIAVAPKPALVIADEPETGLDPVLRRSVIELLVKVVKQNGAGLLLISHHEDTVDRIADDVVRLKVYEKQYGGCYPEMNLQSVDNKENLQSDILKPDEQQDAVRKSLIVEVKNLYKTFVHAGPWPWSQATETKAVNEVNISVREGDIIALVGQSGSGKTTLSRIILGLETPSSGEIWLNGERWDDLSETQRRPLRKKYQYIPQDSMSALDPQQTALESTEETYRILAGNNRKEANVKAKKLLISLGLKDRLHALPREMSGGEQRRVTLARVLALTPSLIVADEPTSGLDPERRSSVLESLFGNLPEKSGCILVTHDMAEATRWCNRIYVMLHGRVIEEINPQENDPTHEYTKLLFDPWNNPLPNNTMEELS
jgi:peptide/nickel transport system ATP-binding protein